MRKEEEGEVEPEDTVEPGEREVEFAELEGAGRSTGPLDKAVDDAATVEFVPLEALDEEGRSIGPLDNALEDATGAAEEEEEVGAERDIERR